jgi:hypothetical protein
MNRLEITMLVKVAGKTPRRLNVRADMTVGDLLNATRDHFNLAGPHELRLLNGRQALNVELPLVDAGVRPGAQLECVMLQERSNTPALIERGERMPFSQRYEKVSFRDQNGLAEYELRWWPAILGRRDIADPSRNRLLAVDLETDDKSRGVSRHHACVTEAGGAFLIEALSLNNPVYLDGGRLAPGMRHPLPTGSSVQLGRAQLTFTVRN